MTAVERRGLEQSEGKRGRALVIAAVMAALFVSAISQTVVSTALPRIIGELGGLSLYSWVLTASMLASTAATEGPPAKAPSPFRPALAAHQAMRYDMRGG